MLAKILFPVLALALQPAGQLAARDAGGWQDDPAWAAVDETVELSLSADGQITLAGKSVDESVLRQTLEWAIAANPNTKAVIEAHRDCKIAAVVELMQMVRELGYESIDLRTAAGAGVAPPPEKDTGKAVGLDTVRGGGEASRRAVELGLDWLRRHQDPDGFWDCDDFSAQCKSSRCEGKGGATHDVGSTAIALLAFLGNGQTHTTGPDRDAVRRGLDYLIGVQNEDDGCVGPRSSMHFAYDHALASLTLCEAFALSGDENLRQPAQRAVDFIARARNPYKAWRYSYPPAGDNDMSITGWMLLALRSAEDGGLKVDPAALRDGYSFLDEMTDPATGRTGYQSRGSLPAREVEAIDLWPPDRSESMTAVAMLLRLLGGEDPGQSKALKAGGDLLVRKPPVWDEEGGRIDMYYWHFGTYAMWQMAGAYWHSWQRSILEALVPTQRMDGDEKGSWNPQVDPWGNEGGRVYSTALNVLTLEVYYRVARLSGAR